MGIAIAAAQGENCAFCGHYALGRRVIEHRSAESTRAGPQEDEPRQVPRLRI